MWFSMIFPLPLLSQQRIMQHTKNVCLLPTNTQTHTCPSCQSSWRKLSPYVILKLCSIRCSTCLKVTMGKHFICNRPLLNTPLLTSLLLYLPSPLKTAVSSKCPAFCWETLCNSVARCCILDTGDWTWLIIGWQFNFLGIKGDLLGFESVPIGGILKRGKKGGGKK